MFGWDAGGRRRPPQQKRRVRLCTTRHPVGVVIPQHLLGILDRLYSADLTECRADLARGVSHILETASKRGVLRSGFTAHEMKGLYCMELRIRANHLWETSKRVIIESGVDVHPIDPIELKEEIGRAHV